jgi:hypothetical protein
MTRLSLQMISARVCFQSAHIFVTCNYGNGVNILASRLLFTLLHFWSFRSQDAIVSLSIQYSEELPKKKRYLLNMK